MPPQLKTLIPLFAAFIILFLIARHFLVPDSFGDQGHYRFNSIAENKEMPMSYAGKEACNECHAEKATSLESDVHATLSCESCHGPGLAHISDPKTNRMTIHDQREFCGICHEYNPSRGKAVQQVDMEVHNAGKKCIECHNPHAPWENK